MGLATLLRKLGSEHGIEIDDDELSELGLSDEPSPEPDADLADVLSAEAAGAIEIFLSEPRSQLAGGQAIESSDGLMWEPIIREGQWAVRPGAGGKKVRRPLKVVAGRSKDQRKQIGLQDIVDAFEDGAVEHVTVPTSHDNKVTENTGFIKGLKIVKATIKDKLSKADKTVSVLMGGYDIRKDAIKESMNDGSIANRSAGLLYDYVNTETGKKYPVVLEHVALTNKPWITGMKAFGRKLVKKLSADPIGLSLSDDDPAEDELLAQEDALEGLELATAEVTWTHEESPNWLQGQVNSILSEARSEKIKAARKDSKSLVYEDYPRHYTCREARPGSALIADGWGDEANYWIASIKVVDGKVEIDDFDEWTAVKKAYVVDDREPPDKGDEPLDEEEQRQTQPPVELSRIELARKARRERAQKDEGSGPEETNTTTSRGGEHMAGESGTLQFSEEAQKQIRAAEERARQAEEKANRLEGQVNTLLSDRISNRADSFVAQLRRDGFTEESGFTGVLTVVHDLLAEDDGEPVLQSDKFADDGNATGELDLSEVLSRVFKAFERAEDGKLKLSQQVVQPPEAQPPSEGEQLGDGGDGKPKAGGEEDKAFEELSEEEQLAALAKDNPELASRLRLAIPSANGNGKEGE